MKTKYFLMALLVSFSQLISAASIQKVTVNFDGLDKFTDFQSRENKSKKDQERLMVQLQKLMGKSGNRILAEGAQLTLTVKDVDIAGRFIYPGGAIDLRNNVYNNDTRAVRVVKDGDKASVDFDYELKDKNGSVLKQGHKSLSSRNLNSNAVTKLKYQNTNFGSIIPLFDTWLKQL